MDISRDNWYCNRSNRPESPMLSLNHRGASKYYMFSCFLDLHQRPRLWQWFRKNASLHDKARTTHAVTTQLGSYVPLLMIIAWLDFGEMMFATFLANFCSDVIFQCQTLYWQYISNGWSNWHDQKGRVSIAYWVNYLTLTFNLIYEFHLRFYMVQFRNCCIPRIVGPIERMWIN